MKPWLLLLALLGTGSIGCAPKFHVLGQLVQELPAITHSASISVEVDPEAPSSLHGDVSWRVERVLQQVGYQMTSGARADYALLFDFGTVEATSGPPMPRAGLVRRGSTGELWRHYLRLRLIDARLLRRTREISVVWAGWAELHELHRKNPREPEELLDLFLVALLEHFPEDTGGFLKVSVTPNDPRVKALRGQD